MRTLREPACLETNQGSQRQYRKIFGFDWDVFEVQRQQQGRTRRQAPLELRRIQLCLRQTTSKTALGIPSQPILEKPLTGFCDMRQVIIFAEFFSRSAENKK